MTDTEHKLMVLADIARELNKEKITWAIGASLMLYLRGIVTQFHDIDIMVAECDAERAEQAICRIGKEQPRNGTAQYKTRYFIEFTVDGVDVDLMAGFVIVLDGTDSRVPAAAGGHYRDPYSKRRECPAALCRALGGVLPPHGQRCKGRYGKGMDRPRCLMTARSERFCENGLRVGTASAIINVLYRRL